ncbi:hypothetical protein NQ317_009933 [Molorchus minor]|uniref:Arrestin C-terminal-like domain-containing protein n=1 Tax=Molorchus minor TaxID=1323400 RepID=A0ABQ9K9J6_9CUCU|nr:hypothetical protein NQ317_009933 [Molorchus minor]
MTNPTKRNSVRLAIRKIMYAPSKQGEQPSVEVSKEFMMSPNKLYLEASLDKELYHHGENIAVNVHIANNSNRTVKKIKVSVRQFADICLFSTAQYKCTVAETESDAGCPIPQGYTLNKIFYVRPILADNKDKRGLALDGQLKHEDTNLASSTIQSRRQQQVCHFTDSGLVAVGVEGCPIGPGFTLSKVFTLTPLLANNKDKWGLALDGQLKHEDTNLASSTLVADPSQRENLGIIVQYKVKVKLCLGALGGDLVAELPFILMHPKPEEEVIAPPTPSRRLSKDAGNDVPVDANLIQLDARDILHNNNFIVYSTENNLQDHDDDIIFEDFARLRLKGERLMHERGCR